MEYKMDLINLEEIQKNTKASYRTVKKRLEEAGIKPVKKKGNEILYDARPAIMAASDESTKETFKLMEKVYTTDAVNFLFGYSSKFPNTITGYLVNEIGLSPEKALKVLSNMFMIYCHSMNEYMGYGEFTKDGEFVDGLNYQITSFLQDLMDHQNNLEVLARRIYPTLYKGKHKKKPVKRKVKRRG